MPAPNSITFNTFLSACHKAGDLEAAVAAVTRMRQLRLPRDAPTYTTLIATVARKRSSIAGLYDPTPAFAFLQEMMQDDNHIKPNGMTYSALIDVCGRCRRSDLALQGLRLMLQQKRQEQEQQQQQQEEEDDDDDVSTRGRNSRHSSTYSKNKNNSSSKNNKNNYHNSNGKNYTLPGEVGAWTAAINACGKAGRLDTAIRLFYAMPNFGVTPNTITCGSITDSLLRAGRTAETLDILRYMKQTGIPPSEVMYTSLMSRAGKLVELERQRDTDRQQRRRPQPDRPTNNNKNDDDGMVRNRNRPDSHNHHHHKSSSESTGSTKAIEVYTALMDSLINTKGETTTKTPTTATTSRMPYSKTLVKVFLVYQEMKRAGVHIDLPCYNTLLRACAQAGDFDRAKSLIWTMVSRGDLDPNDTSWRLLLRAAITSFEDGRNDDNPATAGQCRVEAVEQIWKQALSYRNGRATSSRRPWMDDTTAVTSQWRPSVDTFVTLISVYLREADRLVRPSRFEKLALRRQYLEKVVQLYDNILLSRNNDEMGMNRMNIDELLNSQRAMMAILQAIVNLVDDVQLDNDMELINEVDHRSSNNGSISFSRQRELRLMVMSILQLECFGENKPDDSNHVAMKMSPSARQVLRRTRLWSKETIHDKEND